jgi:hypothetical protein
MKTNKHQATRRVAIGVALAAIIGFALISCSDGGGNNSPPPPPQEQPTERTTGTTKDLSFGTGCKVTIEGVAGEKYLNAEWTALCDKVVAAIMRGYNKLDTSLNHGCFEATFSTYFNYSIVLLKTATYDCEVKENDLTTLYLKINIIDTVDIQPAVWALSDGEAYHYP